MIKYSKMKNIPFLGVGIGFRSELKTFIFLNRDKINFLEIIADHYIDVSKEKLDYCIVTDTISKQHLFGIVSNNQKGIKQLITTVTKLNKNKFELLFCLENTVY